MASPTKFSHPDLSDSEDSSSFNTVINEPVIDFTSVLIASTSTPKKNAPTSNIALNMLSQPTLLHKRTINALIKKAEDTIAEVRDEARVKTGTRSNLAKMVLDNLRALCKIIESLKVETQKIETPNMTPIDTCVPTPLPVIASDDASTSSLLLAINALTCQTTAALNAHAISMAEMRKEIKEMQTPKSTPSPTSYSEAAGLNARPTQARVQKRADAPKQNVPYSLVFQAKDTKVIREDAQKIFKKEIDLIKMKIGIEKYVGLSNNVTKIDCKSAADRDAIMNAINKCDALRAEASRKKNPMLILMGVHKDVLESDLLSCIIEQNPEIEQATNAQPDGLKIRFKRRNKQAHLDNYVLEATPQVRAALLGLDRICVGYGKVRIADFSNFIQCYKCFGFGHTTTHCKSTHNVCGHCAEHHKTLECQKLKEKSAIKCVNCYKSNAKFRASDPTSHSASDRRCPQVKKMYERATQMTNYVS